MNFEHYYSILQQIGKPTFLFDKLENEEIISISIENYQMYIIEKELSNNIRSRLFCILVEKMEQCYIHNQIKNNNLVKFYDTNNFYITYCNIALPNKNFIKTTEIINEINNFDFNEFSNLRHKLKRSDEFLFGIWEVAQKFEFFIWGIARKSYNNCYFNITTTQKDYFTLEIIAVIHKL